MQTDFSFPSVSRWFPAVRGSAAAARRFVEHSLDRLHPGEIDSEAAVLLTSELVSNTIVHARGDEFQVVLAIGQGSVTVNVIDSDPGLPVPRPWDPRAERGRGLRLVQELSDCWGVRRGFGGGKSVWFRLGTRLSAPPQPL